MPPLVIEFIGLPGAGKTTIAQKAIEELTANGYRCFGHSTLSTPETVQINRGGIVSKLRTFFSFISSCIVYRNLAKQALLYTLHIRPLNWISYKRFFILFTRLDLLRTIMNNDYDLIVLDQGPIQNIWSIATTGEQSQNNKYLERLLKGILDEISPFVILVDVEADLAIERINNRGTMRSRFDWMPASQAIAMLVKHKGIFNQFVNSTEKFRESGYLNVNGSQPIKKNVGQIVPFIENAWQANSA